MTTRVDCSKQVGTSMPRPGGPATRQDLLAYYKATVDDYRAWSPGMNMHFGYWRWGINPFRREDMLDEMNAQVLRRADTGTLTRVADLGCGTGATARHVVRHCNGTMVDAVTCVPEQIDRGKALNLADSAHAGRFKQRLRFHLADYTDTGLPSGAYDAVFLLESACHAQGPGKEALMREAWRLLRPGGKLVLADELRRDARPLPGLVQRLYDSWCANWAVPELAERHALMSSMQMAGFSQIAFEEISLRLAASALHVPLFATRFALGELWKARGRLEPWRARHILASFAAFALGAWMPSFGYFFVTASKPTAAT